MNEDPTKPELLSDEYIARVIEGGDEEAEVKYGYTNGYTLYQRILAEAAIRLRRYSEQIKVEDDQFAPHYELDAHEEPSCRRALRELLEQDVCIQHGYSGESAYCRDCGGRPEEFGGSGTCPWEIARNALKHGKDI